MCRNICAEISKWHKACCECRKRTREPHIQIYKLSPNFLRPSHLCEHGFFAGKVAAAWGRQCWSSGGSWWSVDICERVFGDFFCLFWLSVRSELTGKTGKKNGHWTGEAVATAGSGTEDMFSVLNFRFPRILMFPDEKSRNVPRVVISQQ